MRKTRMVYVLTVAVILVVFGAVVSAKEKQKYKDLKYPKKFAGKASYYTVKSAKSEGTSGVLTASGETFDEQALTCALRRRDWGKKFLVTNKKNGLSVVVRNNDYGPGNGPTAKGVVIDLTPAGFAALGAGKAGMLEVTVEELE